MERKSPFPGQRGSLDPQGLRLGAWRSGEADWARRWPAHFAESLARACLLSVAAVM